MIQNRAEQFYQEMDKYEAVPWLSLPRKKRREISNFVYEKTIHYLDEGWSEEATIGLVKEEAEKKYGSVIALAILAAIVQFLVIKLLRWLWPDRAT